jgi:hypothetical protein
MGIAMPVGAQRPALYAGFRSRQAHIGLLERPSPIFVTALSGCFSNQHRQHLLRVEVVDAKWQIHRAYRSSADSLGPGRRVRGEKETEGLTLVSTRHSAPQFPLHPYRCTAEVEPRVPRARPGRATLNYVSFHGTTLEKPSRACDVPDETTLR